MSETIWTQFWDMNSGGRAKEDPYQMIYIEAPMEEAKVIFYNRFGHNPERVTCTCCGEDYSISEGTLQQITAYHRNCSFPEGDGEWVEEPRYVGKPWCKPVVSLEDYIKQPDVLVIRAEEISPEERVGSVPTEGYVWL